MDKELLDIICCPKCQGDLKLKEENKLVCEKCGTEYIVKDGIPVLLDERI